jgi:DNA polymerase-1
MQGTAADIIKMAMINVYQWLTTNNIAGVKLVMQVHDELVFEINQDLVEQYLPILTDLMQSAASLNEPLIADSGIGDNRDQAH